MGTIAKPQVPVLCQQCNSSFMVTQHNFARGGGKYCSLECSFESKRIHPPPQKEIEDLYTNKQFSTNDLAKHYKVSKGKIWQWVILYKIKMRDFRIPEKHPMKGKTHSDKTKLLMRNYWTTERRKERSRQVTARLKTFPQTVGHGNRRSYGGRREDLNQYFRSAWEANVARYLNFLMVQGEVVKWTYEEDTFWFEKIRRGTRSYTPDFKIWFKGKEDKPEYWEIKGYMDAKSKTKVNRMNKYYPQEKVTIIDADAYNAIKKWKALIPGWETAPRK